MINSLMQRAAIDLAKQYDEKLFKEFERHGYSRDWITDEENRHRIICFRQTGSSIVNETWKIDGEPLFVVHLIYKMTMDGMNFKYNIEMEVEDINLDNE